MCLHGGITEVRAIDLNDIRDTWHKPSPAVRFWFTEFMQLSLALRHRNRHTVLCAFPRLALTQRFRAYSPLLSPHPTVCPSCDAPLPTRLPACPKCFHIERSRPGNKYDYYDLLETPKSPNPFVVNESRLKNNFRRVQRYVHPDVWATQGQVHHSTN